MLRRCLAHLPSSLRSRCCTLLATALVLAAPAGAQPLPADVESALAAARLPRDSVAIYLAEAAPRAAPRLAHRAEAPMNPASVMKLVTTYAGLDLLGPAYTWNTPVGLDGRIAGGVLQGNLVLRGQGDPQLVQERLWMLLRRVQALGVRSIAGDIVLDRSAFSLPPGDPGRFDGEPHRPYNAAPDALLVNYKSLVLGFLPDPPAGVARVTVEPPLAGLAIAATVPLAPAGAPCGDWRAALQAQLADPVRIAFSGSYPASCGERAWPLAPAGPDAFAARAVKGMWRSLGGGLSGRVRDGRWPEGLQPAFTVASPPLAEVVRTINKFSNNVMAEQLFLTLALQQAGRADPETAREVLRRWWSERLPAAALPLLDNGSGLSREGRIGAAALGAMLQQAWSSPLMPDLLASLPLAGVDGTLRRRGAIAGAAHLKTGSLRDVAAIAGYVHGASGRRWVLVAMVNHPSAGAAQGFFTALVNWAARDSAP